MAFFKFRKSAGDSSATPQQPDSVEVMRKRAKHRLIGATVLVLAGVIGFPLLFDNQPRPIAVDIPIEIPDKNKVNPLVVPSLPATPAQAVAQEPVAQPVTVAPAAPVVSVSEPAGVVPAPVVAAKPVAKPVESVPAQVLPAAKAAEKKEPVAESRFVVQIGAFADVTKAREARLKVEHAGLKTYTQVVETKDGRRIRVRVGPFTGRTEAEHSAEKIRKLDLPAAILTL
ncbi:MAG: hypothetical protein RIS34_2300 [Pseudomonadota bacterium]